MEARVHASEVADHFRQLNTTMQGTPDNLVIVGRLRLIDPTFSKMVWHSLNAPVAVLVKSNVDLECVCYVFMILLCVCATAYTSLTSDT